MSSPDDALAHDQHAAAVDRGRPDFEIGLALAGAISAGAYTAGVIDFLVQALQEWEKARPAGAPAHRVRIRTIAGASAGAITGALGVVALSRGLRPVPLSRDERDAAQGTAGDAAERDRRFQAVRCVLPTLYDAWVSRPRMVAASGSGALDLLGSDDLKAPAGGGRQGPVVRSLLNAALLDEIAGAALGYPGSAGPPADPGQGPLAWTTGPLPFLSETMHVFMTVTNLRGIPFDVAFGKARYGMLTHGDRLHYRIDMGWRPSGAAATWQPNDFLKLDKTIDLGAASLPGEPGERVPDAWAAYGGAALASGAFPGGLAPRAIATPFALYENRQYPLPVTYGSIHPKFPPACDLKGAFEFLAVDGGVVNNSPFDFVEYALWDRGEPRRAPAVADRAVLMVAPFPEPPTFLSTGQPRAELVSVVRALFPTLLNQSRFRSSELGAALDEDDRSRFLISPRRSLANGPKERYPIACGLLGGFGGFLDEAFRAHDYQLGRRNCQNFLASVFGLPGDNAAIAAGGARDDFRTAPRPNDAYDTGSNEFMIVPLVGEAAREVGLPPWPQMSGADVRTLMRRIAGRFDAIKGPLVDGQVSKPEIRWAAGLLVRASRPRLLNFVELTILADLVRRNQIAGWDLPPEVVALTDQARDGRQTDDVRLILASLVGPAQVSATVQQIADATHLDGMFVEQVLAALATLPESRPHRVSSADGVYRLQMHVPAGMRAWPWIGRWIERFGPQSYRYR